MKMTETEANQPQVTVERLLELKRNERPSEAMWGGNFDRSFNRKLIGALARPRRTERTLTVVGWLSPVLFAAAVGVAVGVAYLFSPQRAMARWESQARSRQYVVDAIHDNDVSSRSYAIDSSDYRLTTSTANGVASYQFEPGRGHKSNF